MKLIPIPFKKTLNKAYQKVKPSRSDIENFKANLIHLLDRIDVEESEENVKNHLRDFLNNTYYKGQHLLNTKGKTDLVLHEDNTAKSKASVLFEVKRPKNSADMITAASPNYKAMHELILYYLRERIVHGNKDVKHLAITNIYEWYVFDATDFDRLFYQNKKLRKDYEDWKLGRKAQSSTDFFYKEIAAEYMAASEEELNAAYFDLRKFEKPLRNNDPTDDRKLIPLFKIFSPPHLLKQPFANDSNSLDKGFYSELLHLIGLEEIKEKGKKVIGRCAPERRQPGSLLENTIAILESTERWRRVRGQDFPSLKDLGSLNATERKNEQIFAVALELCITWMNRILFLKLLEAQLIKYHGSKDRSFLNTQLLKDFDELNELFFEVLAKLPEERAGYVQEKFSSIPYLNSSLFEISEVEADTLFISNLKDRFRIRPMSGTVLKDAKGKRRTEEMTILEYLFAFLDAYDFASEGSEEIQEENKTLINASVLGLIFEKLNGYKDGSFFTPGFITMYMARETVRRAVVQKFNDKYGIDCEGFADVKNFAASKFKTADVLEMNALVNSLRICDPAVGSGHFLVSVLNEVLAIKSELGILADAQGERLRGYEAKVENDELIVTCNDGQDLFEYRLAPQPPTGVATAGNEAQLVQETLFHEKQTIIENCLFGVDINPNSVKICRLRLWIELLKNTYYKGGTEKGGLETLPNIDINIKTGNSLISRFALDADLSKALKSVKYDIGTYRRYVQEYHHATDKETKRGLLALMDQIKSDFRSEIHRNDPLIKRKSKLAGELYNLTQQTSLFGMTEAEAKKRKKEVDKKSQDLEKLESQIKEIEENRIYENAFEWRFEFPEVLDEEGRFVGFDVVVGNPPYGVSFSNEQKSFLKNTFTTIVGKYDSYGFFIELSVNLIKNKGQIGFITPHTWLTVTEAKSLRELLLSNCKILEINKLPSKVFEDATVETINILISKENDKIARNSNIITALIYPELEKLSEVITFKVVKNVFKQSNWIDDNSFNIFLSENDSSLLNKLRGTGFLMADICEFSVGIQAYDSYAGQSKEIISKRAYHSETKKDDSYLRELNGRDMFRYGYQLLENSWVSYGDWLAHPRQSKYFNQERILVREITALNKYSIISCYVKDHFINYKSILNIILSEHSKQKGYDIFYILGLINSSLISWYFEKSSNKIVTKTFPRISIFDIKQFPLPSLNLENINDRKLHDSIGIISKNITKIKTDDATADTSTLEQEIDQLVYQLYGLTEEEVRIVEGV